MDRPSFVRYMEADFAYNPILNEIREQEQREPYQEMQELACNAAGFYAFHEVKNKGNNPTDLVVAQALKHTFNGFTNDCREMYTKLAETSDNPGANPEFRRLQAIRRGVRQARNQIAADLDFKKKQRTAT